MSDHVSVSTTAPGDTLRPDSESQAIEAITWAAQHQGTLELVGLGSKRAFGHPVSADHLLDLSALSGVTDYSPAELVITAGAGTPLNEIRATLAEHGQHLACEPLCLGRLFSADGAAPASEGTLGGIVNTNLSGARRASAGAVRDHLLGVKGINGQGVPFKAGGQVVKNVTGFDLCKLLAGSWGTLAALTQVSLKVLPVGEKTRTVVLYGLSDEQAVRAMTAALSSPWEVSGAAHLPATIAAASAVDRISSNGQAVTLLRVEGPAPSVAARCQALRTLLSGPHHCDELHTQNSRALWEELRTSALLAARRPALVWRLSVVPSQAAALAETLRQSFAAAVGAEVTMDWGGGQLWLLLGARDLPTDGGAHVIRQHIATHGGGHATLVLAPLALRRAVPIFQPQPATLAALNQRIKHSLDPGGVFTPHRMALSP